MQTIMCKLHLDAVQLAAVGGKRTHSDSGSSSCTTPTHAGTAISKGSDQKGRRTLM